MGPDFFRAASAWGFGGRAPEFPISPKDCPLSCFHGSLGNLLWRSRLPQFHFLCCKVGGFGVRRFAWPSSRCQARRGCTRNPQVPTDWADPDLPRRSVRRAWPAQSRHSWRAVLFSLLAPSGGDGPAWLLERPRAFRHCLAAARLSRRLFLRGRCRPTSRRGSR